MKIKALNEEQSQEHKQINRRLKKEFEALLEKPLLKGSTIHHVDKYVDPRDITNCLCIESNQIDANVIHVLIEFCQRYRITNVDQLIARLNSINIYSAQRYLDTWTAAAHNFTDIVESINTK